MVLIPGRNLATSRDRAPCRENISLARPTQVSGLREIRQRKGMTFSPRRFPRVYQLKSAISEALQITRKIGRISKFPEPTRAPATSNKGADGMGRPNCSNRTQKNRTA